MASHNPAPCPAVRVRSSREPRGHVRMWQAVSERAMRSPRCRSRNCRAQDESPSQWPARCDQPPRRTLADHDPGRYLAPRAHGARGTQHSPGAWAAARNAPDFERTVDDGFMADARMVHRREVDRQAAASARARRRRCFRGPCRRPFQRTAGPGTGDPLEATTTPANRSST
jgi:hypothetical protein